jgi:hypothetical protein
MKNYIYKIIILGGLFIGHSLLLNPKIIYANPTRKPAKNISATPVEDKGSIGVQLGSMLGSGFIILGDGKLMHSPQFQSRLRIGAGGTNLYFISHGYFFLGYQFGMNVFKQDKKICLNLLAGPSLIGSWAKIGTNTATHFSLGLSIGEEVSYAISQKLNLVAEGGLFLYPAFTSYFSVGLQWDL